MFLVFIFILYTGLQYYSATYGIKRRVCRGEWLS